MKSIDLVHDQPVEKLRWDHFDAVDMARFLHRSVDEVKRLTPRQLCAETMRQIALNARLERARLGGAFDHTPAPTSPAKGS